MTSEGQLQKAWVRSFECVTDRLEVVKKEKNKRGSVQVIVKSETYICVFWVGVSVCVCVCVA